MAEYGHDDEGAHAIEDLKANHAEINAQAEAEVVRTWHSFSPLISLNLPFASNYTSNGDVAENATKGVWDLQPTYLIIEGLFLFLAVWGLYDASKRHRGMLTFMACLVGGTAVELLTVMHQEIGNFYHSQAVIMLFGRREPLYMLLGCYGWVAYMAMVLADKYGCGYAETAAFAGLIGSEAWALLDTVGAQFMWWTWHNGEPLYEDREGGVPVASSFWIMSSMAALAVCIKFCKSNHWAWGFVVGPVATIGLMNVPFTFLYHPIVTWQGLHAVYAMTIFRAICLVPVALKLFTSETITIKNPFAKDDDDSAIYRQLLLYVFAIVLVALACDPTEEERTSFSQECCSDCDAMETSFWGAFNRTKYTCPEYNSKRPENPYKPEEGPTFMQDKYKLFDERCDNSYPGELEHWPDGSWYTVQGTPKEEDFDKLVVIHAVILLILGALPFFRSGRSAELKKADSADKKKDE